MCFLQHYESTKSNWHVQHGVRTRPNRDKYICCACTRLYYSSIFCTAVVENGEKLHIWQKTIPAAVAVLLVFRLIRVNVYRSSNAEQHGSRGAADF